MNGFTRTFWRAVGAFAAWRAERAVGRSSWWAQLARECERRAREERRARG